MALLNEKFVSQGYPVVIGEFGAQDKTEKFADYNEFRRYWLNILSRRQRKTALFVYTGTTATTATRALAS